MSHIESLTVLPLQEERRKKLYVCVSLYIRVLRVYICILLNNEINFLI